MFVPGLCSFDGNNIKDKLLIIRGQLSEFIVFNTRLIYRISTVRPSYCVR